MQSTRRRFLQATALAGAGLSIRPFRGHAENRETAQAAASATPKISIAGYEYDRVEALVDGRVKVEGCDTTFQVSTIGAMNTNVFAGPNQWDVTEIGLSPFLLAFANEQFRDYTLLPVFPLRLFRHRSIFIRTDRGIQKPQDLRGKKVATPGYSSTSLTWIRGMLQDEYGIRPDQIEWVISAKDSSAKASGGPSKQENVLPEGLQITTGPEGRDESELLTDGHVDALFHAAEPKAYIDGHPQVGRLFENYRQAEREYFRKTGIFPIMHAVAIRRDLINKHPGLPTAVFHAYSQAKRRTYEFMKQAAWFKNSLPWYGQEFAETRRLMGDNFYAYGIQPNRKTLETLFRYSHQQGLASRQLTIEELFESSTLNLTEPAR